MAREEGPPDRRHTHKEVQPLPDHGMSKKDEEEQIPKFSLPLNSDLLLEAPIDWTQLETMMQKGPANVVMEAHVLGYIRAKNGAGLGPGG